MITYRQDVLKKKKSFSDSLLHEFNYCGGGDLLLTDHFVVMLVNALEVKAQEREKHALFGFCPNRTNSTGMFLNTYVTNKTLVIELSATSL